MGSSDHTTRPRLHNKDKNPGFLINFAEKSLLGALLAFKLSHDMMSELDYP